MDLLARLVTHLRSSGLLPAGTRVVVALSGGSDSTALLELLARAAPRLGFELEAAAHLNHRLRGEEAELDADFCARLAERRGLRFVRGDADVRAIAREGGESIEAAGRRARYAFLGRTAAELGGVVATGHTADDRLETLLLKLARGEGTGALAGIRPRRRDGVVRPLLPFLRRELRGWLVERGIAWRDDSTNESGVGSLRARLRAALPPLEETLGRDLARRASRSLDRLVELEEFLDTEARRIWGGSTTGRPAELDVAPLAGLSELLVRRVVHLFLADAAPGAFPERAARSLVRRIRQGGRPWRHRLTDRVELRLEGAVLSAGEPRGGPGASEPFRYPIELGGTVEVPEAGGRLRAVRTSSSRDRFLADPSVGVRLKVALPVAPEDRDALSTLEVRSRLPGDRIVPLGSPGSRKLKDVFIDRKVPRWERDRRPVVTRRGELIWVVGVVVAEACRLPPGDVEVVELTWEDHRCRESPNR